MLNMIRLTKKIIGRFKFFFSKKPPVTMQFSETECGIAALAMILAYHGTHASTTSLREKCGPSRDGCKASAMIRAAEKYGFSAECYSVDIKDILDLDRPVIAFWNFNHYVVICKICGDEFYIHDPALGAVVITHDEFDKSFTGIIIDIFPTKNVIPLKQKSIMRSLLSECICQYYAELLFIMICLFLLAAIPLINSFYPYYLSITV